jgi:ATP-binding cassette subfamily B protein
MPRSVVSIARIDDVLAQPAAPVPGADRRTPLPDEPLDVEFDAVVYGYDEAPVLQELTLRVAPGEILAVVGSTGAGKSTLTNLLIRADDPRAGTVRVGGVDLREADPSSLRASVSMVFQESFLFADTIGENIALGVTDDPTAIREAAAVARADEFIGALPRGYDTVVGERGVTLSGGQRQRVALARALVRRPRLLILDDATSAVDPTIEAEILDGLRRTLDTTTIIVAHRVSTIELADRVAYVDAGRVVATGTHDELLRLPGYEAIVRAYEQGEVP